MREPREEAKKDSHFIKAHPEEAETIEAKA